MVVPSIFLLFLEINKDCWSSFSCQGNGDGILKASFSSKTPLLKTMTLIFPAFLSGINRLKSLGLEIPKSLLTLV